MVAAAVDDIAVDVVVDLNDLQAEQGVVGVAKRVI